MILQERHKVQYLFSVAIIFLILGLGNVIYGHVKYKEYKGIYKETTKEIKDNSENRTLGQSHQTSFNLENFSERSRHLKRSQGRIIFYKFFMTGGKVFLCISLIFFIFSIHLLRKSKRLKE